MTQGARVQPAINPSQESEGLFHPTPILLHTALAPSPCYRPTPRSPEPAQRPRPRASAPTRRRSAVQPAWRTSHQRKRWRAAAQQLRAHDGRAGGIQAGCVTGR